MSKTALFLILIIIAFLAYLGLIYVSATSAKFSVSWISLSRSSDLVQALLTRRLDLELHLKIEGRGPLPVKVKSLSGRVYLEDRYIGNIKSTEPFTIPASGTTTVHFHFLLDLSGISLTDIQYIIDSISSHNGEVKISLDCQLEPIIFVFTIVVPISYQTYILTVSDAPVVSNFYWSPTSVAAGEFANFYVTVKNVFRGFRVHGTVIVIVKEDIAGGFDVDASVYRFPVDLSPGESTTLSGSFRTYKRSSTRGFYLRVLWGSNVLAEQENKYPPRLNVLAGSLSLVEAYWTVRGIRVSSCRVGDEVTAHVVLKAVNGPVDGVVKIKVKKDVALGLDEDVRVASFIVSLRKDEQREYTITFVPSEPSGNIVRGYFIEIEGDLSWTMPDAYPPRLKVGEIVRQGTLLINAWWTVGGRIVTEAEKGQIVTAHVLVKAVGGSFKGRVVIRIRRDLALQPDEDHKIQSFNVELSEGQSQELTVVFLAAEKSSLTFKGYFIRVDFDSSTWTMESSYPPRLKVKG